MEEYFDGDDLKLLLLECAHALQDGNLKVMDALLDRIWTLAAEFMTDVVDEDQGRVVKYYAEALVRRAYGLHPSLAYFYSLLPCYFLYDESLLYNYEIKAKVFKGKKQKQVHLIDFYLPHLYHRNRGYLFDGMRKLVCGETTVCVRVSVVLPPFLKGIVDVGREEQYLARQAEEMEIEFKNLQMVYANSLGEMNPKLPFMLNLLGRRAEDDDEALVIFYSSKLNKLLAEEGALERELKRLAQINPDVVFITEPNANHNQSNFIQRLDHSFPFYFYNRALGIKEEIVNIVGCEGKDRVVRHLTLQQWRSLFEKAGFMIPIPLHSKSKSHYYKEKYGCVVDDNRFLSAWKFSSVDDFNPISFNSRLRDINPGPPLEDTVEPIPVLKEHSSMNRLAALAEIYDMLQDIYFKYEIPLALTWVCGDNRTLSLETTSSYYIDDDIESYVESCSEYNLEEGQGIAGKALQSNEPFLFEPDITLLEEPDSFASVVRKFKFDSHAAVAICLKNNYIDDIYVLEFFIPPSKDKTMTPESLARYIFDNLSNMKKRFVTLRNHGSTTVDSQKLLKNNNQHVKRSSSAVSYEGDEIRNALPFDHNQQWRETSNSKTGDMQAATSLPLVPRDPSSSLNGMVPINYYGMQQTQGPHDQLENADHTSLEPIGNNEIEIVNEADNYVNELPVSSAKKRKLTSNVWDEFKKVPYNDPKDGKAKVWAICSHCEKKFDGSSKKGTTHLRNHLNRCKIRGAKLVIKDSELTLLPARRGSEPQSVGEGNSSFDQDRSSMDVARMFIEHQLPLNMVESESFSNLLKNLQPMFKLQSQEALLSDILCVYKEEKGRLIEYFEKLSCRLNLMISLWTDDHEKVTNCCFAVQFVEDKWVLKKKIIAFKSLGHEKEFEPKIFLETFESLIAEWKFEKKLCSLTIRNFASSSLEIDEEIRKSWHRFEASYPLSTFYISFDGCINDLLAMYKSSDQLNDSFMKTPSACSLQDIFDIYKKQNQQEKDYPLMNVKYDNNWRMCSLVLAIAAILDPRFKFSFVELLYQIVYGDNSARIHLSKIRSALSEIFDDYASNFCCGKSLLDDASSLASLTADENITEFFQRCYNSEKKMSTEVSELDKYLQEPITRPETEQFEVLNWWGEHASEFPILGRMARDILAIPMSTVIQGSSLDEKVTMDIPVFKGLNPQIIEAMICGKDWLESPQETGLACLAVEPALRGKNAPPPAHPLELDHLSSESDEEAVSLPMENLGYQALAWSEKDVWTYLISPFTEKEMEYLSKWQSHQISGVHVGRDKILDTALAPLLLIPPSDDVHLQNPEQYYIDDTVVNQFFILLKRRYDKFPHMYLKHHSFDSSVATKLFQNQSKDLSSWVKRKDLEGTSKLFLPMCLNGHWFLFCADIGNKRLLWLDSNECSRSAYDSKKEVIFQWFLKSVLPLMGYHQPNDWLCLIPTDIPMQKNSVDCGLFVMKYADCLTHGNYFPFTQEDMPHFRHRTFLDLICGRIHSGSTQGSKGTTNNVFILGSSRVIIQDQR